VTPQSRPFDIATLGEQEELSFDVTPPAGETTARLKAIATVGGRDVAAGMEMIQYPHIPIQALFPPSTVKLVRANIQVAVKRVGYIMGAGDEMPDALRQMGLEVTLLTPSDLEQGDLSKYEAIVAGVRAYGVRADLRANHPRLMQYVNNGGTYIVQYQREEGADGGGFAPLPAGGRGGPGAGQAAAGQPPAQGQPTQGEAAQGQPAQGQSQPQQAATPQGRGGQPGQQQQGAAGRVNYGPYPMTVPGGNANRITVEEAPVTFPHIDSRLLQYPNRITQKDFEGWVQERGVYFATQWDPRYQTVLSSKDPSEEPLAGGELWTHYGKGVYIFTAYSWFRQLPAGVPGAYRLFANLLSAK
jgi:hypothetical protein